MKVLQWDVDKSAPAVSPLDSCLMCRPVRASLDKSCVLNAKFIPVAFRFLHGHLTFLLPSPPLHQNEMN